MLDVNLGAALWLSHNSSTRRKAGTDYQIRYRVGQFRQRLWPRSFVCSSVMSQLR
jgi:hypothetical protein